MRRSFAPSSSSAPSRRCAWPPSRRDVRRRSGVREARERAAERAVHAVGVDLTPTHTADQQHEPKSRHPFPPRSYRPAWFLSHPWVKGPLPEESRALCSTVKQPWRATASPAQGLAHGHNGAGETDRGRDRGSRGAQSGADRRTHEGGRRLFADTPEHRGGGGRSWRSRSTVKPRGVLVEGRRPWRRITTWESLGQHRQAAGDDPVRHGRDRHRRSPRSIRPHCQEAFLDAPALSDFGPELVSQLKVLDDLNALIRFARRSRVSSCSTDSPWPRSTRWPSRGSEQMALDAPTSTWRRRRVSTAARGLGIGEKRRAWRAPTRFELDGAAISASRSPRRRRQRDRVRRHAGADHRRGRQVTDVDAVEAWRRPRTTARSAATPASEKWRTTKLILAKPACARWR